MQDAWFLDRAVYKELFKTLGIISSLRIDHVCLKSPCVINIQLSVSSGKWEEETGDYDYNDKKRKGKWVSVWMRNLTYF